MRTRRGSVVATAGGSPKQDKSMRNKSSKPDKAKGESIKANKGGKSVRVVCAEALVSGLLFQQRASIFALCQGVWGAWKRDMVDV